MWNAPTERFIVKATVDKYEKWWETKYITRTVWTWASWTDWIINLKIDCLPTSYMRNGTLEVTVMKQRDENEQNQPQTDDHSEDLPF